MVKGAASYKEVDIQSEVLTASPHRLIQLLLNKCQQHLNLAIYAVENNNIKQKCLSISKANKIIISLREHLDFERGGDIAPQLYDLYTFMENHLLEANLSNNPQELREVLVVLNNIKEGWDGIAEKVAN
jgi:flagellar protein FliS